MLKVTPLVIAASMISLSALAGPVSDAAKQGDVKEIEQLLASGADANEVDALASPLHWAAMNGHVDAVLLLVANDANLDAPSSMLGTPLHAAARFGRVEVIEALIEAGADPELRNKDDFTPLLIAITEGRLSSVMALLEGGVNVDAVTTRNRGRGRGPTIPLHEAISSGHEDIEAALRAAGAGPIPPEVPKQLLAAGDAERGRELAYKDCQGCHTILLDDPPQTKTANAGPPLVGVVGSAVASQSGFEYSSALVEYAGTWTPERLFQFSYRPTLTVPGTHMRWSFDRTPEMVADMVAFFNTQAD